MADKGYDSDTNSWPDWERIESEEGLLETLAERRKRRRDEQRANEPADWEASSHEDDDYEAGGDSSLPYHAYPSCTNCGYHYREGLLWCPQCSRSIPTAGITDEQKEKVLERQFRIQYGDDPGFQWRSNPKTEAL
jgi:hypothetical protein